MRIAHDKPNMKNIKDVVELWCCPALMKKRLSSPFLVEDIIQFFSIILSLIDPFLKLVIHGCQRAELCLAIVGAR